MSDRCGRCWDGTGWVFRVSTYVGKGIPEGSLFKPGPALESIPCPECKPLEHAAQMKADRRRGDIRFDEVGQPKEAHRLLGWDP